MSQQEREAFLQAIREEPYEALHRRAYADWLEEHGLDEEADLQRGWTPTAQRRSEAYFEALARECERRPEVLIDELTNYLKTGEPVYFSGFETPDIFLSHYGRKEVWRHYSVITGIPVSDEQSSYSVARCGC